MWCGKKYIIVIMSLLILSGFIAKTQAAKSVFIISKHSTPSQAQAYKIDGDQLTYQAQVDIDTYNPGYGAVGNAVWPEKEVMFVTYEQSPMIVWASTKTLQKFGEFDTGVTNLSGIAVDANREKIYIVQRGTNNLYVYSFNQVNNTLVLDNHYSLEVPSGYLNAWGLALDKTNGLLYVSTDTERVHVYDTTDWSYDHYIDINVGGTNRPAVGIAIDPIRGYLYTGHWQYHNYLVRTNISTQSSIEVEVTNGSYGMPVLGIDVDDETGLVYCTTYHNDFRVYDSNLILKDTEANNISGPGGVSVGGWYKTPSFTLVKDNNDPNNGCVEPWDPNKQNYLTFDIRWDANGHPDTNVVVVDQLPAELDYNSFSPAGDYNDFDKTVKWNIGNIGASASGHIVLKTTVNYWARPCGTITNTVIMEGDTYLTPALRDVSVCSWGGEIIYVDKDANGYNNGTNWQDAYNDLQDALTQARNDCAQVTAIWVANGVYKPIQDANVMTYDETFELVDSVSLFGHFAGGESSTLERNFADANHETVLEGQIGTEYYEAVYNIVTAENMTSGLVDGFTIRDAYYNGVYLNEADIGIVNCKILDNGYYGIYAQNYSYPDIHNCVFRDNSSKGVNVESNGELIASSCIFDGNDSTSDGVYMYDYAVTAYDCIFKNHNSSGIDMSEGSALTLNNCSIKTSNINGIQASSYCNLTIDHSVIADNSSCGLYTYNNNCQLTLTNSVVRNNGSHGLWLNNNSTTTIKNSWIHKNGSAGISFVDQSSIPLVRNDTIYDNYTYGIECSQTGADPNIRNSIIAGNDSNDLYRVNGSFNKVNYCLLQHAHSGRDNITGDPCFINPADPNDLHIAEDSRCKNAGDPNGNYDNETDIDGENRVYYGRVDIGADEYYWNHADFDEDGYVNLIDYAIIAASWQSKSGDSSYNEDCDLEDNNAIDFNDLALFCDDWLWEKAWQNGWMMAMGEGGGDFGFESMSLMESSLSLDSSETASSAKRSDALMLSAAESLRTRPERLTAKSQKFYDITPETTISARRKALELQPQHQANPKLEPKLQSELEPPQPEPQPQLTEEDIQDLVDWLEELWLTDEQIRSTCPKTEWLEFIETVKQTPITETPD